MACSMPGIDEGIHGIGFALGRFAAFGAGAVDEVFAFVERVAGTVRYAVFRQHHRQLIVRHRYVATAIAVDNGDGAAPESLARDQPVAEPVVDLVGDRHCTFFSPRPSAARSAAMASTAVSEVRPVYLPELIRIP